MLQRFLQTFVISLFFTLFLFASVIGWSLFIFLFFTRFWWIDLLYLGWLLFDVNTPDSGGREILFLKNAKVWSYCKDYLSATTTLVSGFSLQPSRLYVCLTGAVSDFRKIYPDFKVHISILRFLLLTPFMRELGLALGLISCSEKSLNFLLSRPGGGNIVNLNPGGALEAYYAYPGQYKFVVKKRKGFVRVALKNGAPLVPVITFGQNDVFQPVQNQRLRWVQELVRKKIGFAPVLFYGRGYSWFPRRTPLKTVVGKPIDVVKTERPTTQEIEELHERFVEELVKLFDTYKWRFVKNPENVHLEIE